MAEQAAVPRHGNFRHCSLLDFLMIESRDATLELSSPSHNWHSSKRSDLAAKTHSRRRRMMERLNWVDVAIAVAQFSFYYVYVDFVAVTMQRVPYELAVYS